MAIPHKAKADWSVRFGKNENAPAIPEALDLLDRMLVFDPDHRATVEQCLAHPYLAAYRDPDDPERGCLGGLWVDRHQADSDPNKDSPEALQRRLWEELHDLANGTAPGSWSKVTKSAAATRSCTQSAAHPSSP